jgi:hypothetical protein
MSGRNRSRFDRMDRKRDGNTTATHSFVHDMEPPVDRPLQVLCEDQIGTYLVPFPCRWNGVDWKNTGTGDRIEAMVIGWRTPVDTA